MPIDARGARFVWRISPGLYRKGEGVAGWMGSLPRILAGDSFRGVVEALRRARREKRAILWGMGGHVIKCGLGDVLLDLMRRGWVSAFVMNGAASIHDFEIAIAGQTSEDVEAVLPDGRFGAAEETGREMNVAIAEGSRRRGSAWAKRWESAWRRWRSRSSPRTASWPAAYRARVPVTVHVAVETDTPHTHPAADGAAIGEGHPSRFPPAVLIGEGSRSGRSGSERGLRGGAAGGLSEGGFGGAQFGESAGRIHHR